MINNSLFSSSSALWSTPKDLFNYLNDRFHFTLDPCCLKETALCDKYYTPKENGLSHNWSNEIVFMNPPYGKEIKEWVKKAYEESHKGALVVGLIPVRTDTIWWNNYVVGKAHILFLTKRLKFGAKKTNAPFPSAIVIWWGGDSYGYL